MYLHVTVALGNICTSFVLAVIGEGFLVSLFSTLITSGNLLTSVGQLSLQTVAPGTIASADNCPCGDSPCGQFPQIHYF